MTELLAAPTDRPRFSVAQAARTIVLVAGGSLVLAASAKIQIPFWPVPMTLQVLACLGLAGIFGGRLAAGMVGLYLLEGALGLPVLANAPVRGAGLAYIAGPTGGYLVGFLVAALVVGGWVRSGALSPLPVVLKMLAGLAIIYGLGVLWLAQFTGWPGAVTSGALPFLAGDIVKALLAACLVLAAQRLRRAG